MSARISRLTRRGSIPLASAIPPPPLPMSSEDRLFWAERRRRLEQRSRDVTTPTPRPAIGGAQGQVAAYSGPEPKGRRNSREDKPAEGGAQGKADSP